MFFPGPFGWIVTFIFWGLVLFLAVKLFQAIFQSRSGGSDSPALNVLKSRYARGEINKEEYKQMRKEIQ
ncbi:MAG: SHOCT domain-containing protein [Proteobacteria bacterium]|nr:SHOCT domain-containing protein [Pseudomonadota bacterium]